MATLYFSQSFIATIGLVFGLSISIFGIMKSTGQIIVFKPITIDQNLEPLFLRLFIFLYFCRSDSELSSKILLYSDLLLLIDRLCEEVYEGKRAEHSTPSDSQKVQTYFL
tara:strand:- start:17 stop:346 length:330 start_codon:yes stop_codon:yes gene_type:complete